MMGWHGEQAVQQLWPGAGASNVQRYRNFQVHDVSRHGEEAQEPLHELHIGRRPQTPTECIREYLNHFDRTTSE